MVGGGRQEVRGAEFGTRIQRRGSIAAARSTQVAPRCATSCSTSSSASCGRLLARDVVVAEREATRERALHPVVVRERLRQRRRPVGRVTRSISVCRNVIPGRHSAGRDPLRPAPEQLEAREEHHRVGHAVQEHEPRASASGGSSSTDRSRARSRRASSVGSLPLSNARREQREVRRADPQRARDAERVERRRAALAEHVLARPCAEALAVDADLRLRRDGARSRRSSAACVRAAIGTFAGISIVRLS